MIHLKVIFGMGYMLAFKNYKKGEEHMELNDVINLGLINLDLKAKNKFGVINELIEMVYKEQRISSKEEALAAVKYRENLSSTFCGFDIAIPHGISNTVRVPTLCFGRSTAGFNWEDNDDVVKFIFLILVPKNNLDDEDEPTHLEILSTVAKLVLIDEEREQWEKAETKEAILESLINKVKE